MKKYCNHVRKLLCNANTSTKTLIFIGFICLIQTVISVFWDNHDATPSDVAIRSVMSNIFGFIFGEQITDNNNLHNKRLQTILSSAISIICIIVCIITHWMPNISQSSSPIVEIRNLLFASVGFLLGRARSEEKVE